MRFKAVLAASGLVFCPLRVHGQVVRGVAAENDRPVPGVVVLLIDSVSQTVGRSLTTENGEFRIAASRAGTYRIRTLRIGFRPLLTEPFVLAAGATESRRLALQPVPVALEKTQVRDQSACRAFADSGAAVFRLWEQVRGVLISAQLTVEAQTVLATTVIQDQLLDATNRRVVMQRTSVRSGAVSRLWRSPSPDSLHRFGYAEERADKTIAYYAPWLDMLASDAFVLDHCFRFTEDSRSGHLGIEFEPTPERRNIPEIRGTLWIDHATSEPKRLEFRFVNLRAEHAEIASGELGFAWFRDKAWAVASWRIRLPFTEYRSGNGTGELIQLLGGDLALAKRETDTLWTRPRFSVLAVVRDSASRETLGGARVAVPGIGQVTSDAAGRLTLPDMLPGQYVLEVRTPALDSLGTAYSAGIFIVDSTSTIEIRVPSARAVAASICGEPVANDVGIVVGHARVSLDLIGRQTSAPGVDRVTAEWRASAGGVRRLEAPIGYDATFRSCGLPLDADVALMASAAGFATTTASVVRPTAATRLVRPVLTLDRAATRDDAGVDRPATVSARLNDWLRPEFEENRRVGVGHFLTRDDLTKFDGGPLSAALKTIPSFRAIAGPRGQVYPTSSRGPALKSCSGIEIRKCAEVQGAYFSSRDEQRRSGIITACYALVYRDGVAVNGASEPVEPFDISAYAPEQVEGIEFYADPAQTPMKYNTTGAQCGALVIWTRKAS